MSTTTNMPGGDKASDSSAPAPVPLDRPSLPWRASSAMITGLTGMVSRGFLYGFNKVETTGLQRFLKILDEREDADKRERGLLTGMTPSPGSFSLFDINNARETD